MAAPDTALRARSCQSSRGNHAQSSDAGFARRTDSVAIVVQTRATRHAPAGECRESSRNDAVPSGVEQQGSLNGLLHARAATLIDARAGSDRRQVTHNQHRPSGTVITSVPRDTGLDSHRTAQRQAGGEAQSLGAIAPRHVDPGAHCGALQQASAERCREGIEPDGEGAGSWPCSAPISIGAHRGDPLQASHAGGEGDPATERDTACEGSGRCQKAERR